MSENIISYMPNVDLYEQDSEFHLYADMPGVDEAKKEEDLKVQLDKGVLKIEGIGLNSRFVNHERHETGFLEGQYQRSFKLSKEIDEKNITGEFKNGVLHLILPKRKEELNLNIRLD